ncbi:MAG TPA: CRISPR system precrRNA processing endoribonuclease RAMP protein Cas6 [Roseiflexaceae bacterium]|nr:CRISPR system precrRNA processing endoribonuclease RAMP protein Cas6 [Roseiflexaceae bacterium]
MVMHAPIALEPASDALPRLPQLPTIRIRLTLRLLSDGVFPANKGSMLRGGFGYAFQQAACPRSCWRNEGCSGSTICPFRWVFATPHPPDNRYLHDLRDVPRPFVIEPPADMRTQYRAGEALEFTLVLIGRGIDFLPYFLVSFERLGDMGLGRDNVRARLERVEALAPWSPVGPVIYRDGRMLPESALPVTGNADLEAYAARLPADLRITLQGPLRLKYRGAYVQAINPAALVQAACWRIDALAAFHGDGGWQQPYRPLVEAAEQISVRAAQARWNDWRRTSTRGNQPRTMPIGGIDGSAELYGVPPALRAVLLLGSIVHVGKACVFGHGGYRLEGV